MTNNLLFDAESAVFPRSLINGRRAERAQRFRGTALTAGGEIVCASSPRHHRPSAPCGVLTANTVPKPPVRRTAKQLTAQSCRRRRRRRRRPPECDSIKTNCNGQRTGRSDDVNDACSELRTSVGRPSPIETNKHT